MAERAALIASCEGRGGAADGVATLQQGRGALDAVEACVRAAERDPSVVSVGRGGSPDILGEVSCDAAVMDGTTLEAGAVACVRGYLHAVSVAREVMRRLPHVLLVGAGAERFAAECGAERAEMLTAAARRRYERWLSRNVAAARRARLRRGPLAGLAWKSTKKAGGTVVCLARDRQGNIAAATSTSGWAYRYPGRVGDSPIIGAGLYADSRYGACGCTHVGEMTIRAATARSVVLYLKQGMSLESAVKEAMRDLSDLRGGLLGAVTIHAMDRDGRTYAAANRLLGRKLIDHRWQEGMNGPERFRAEVLKGTG